MLDQSTVSRVEMDWSGPERLTMNMGPQHPSAHGVFRAIVTLEGETVVAVDAVIGYLHRCHEKLSETLTYAQYPSIASKTDYVAAMTSEFAYVPGGGGDRQVRGAETRAVPACHRRRVAAHRVAPAVAGDVVHGHGRRARRRRDDLSVLHPRA
jgi:NADH-quinone oxidoreductase subunit D